MIFTTKNETHPIRGFDYACGRNLLSWFASCDMLARRESSSDQSVRPAKRLVVSSAGLEDTQPSSGSVEILEPLSCRPM